MIIHQNSHLNSTTITLTDEEFEMLQGILHSLSDNIQKNIMEVNGYLDDEEQDTQNIKDWEMFHDIIYHKAWPFIQLLPHSSYE